VIEGKVLRNVASLLAVSVVFLCLNAVPVIAQESFEIAVYPYATAHAGEWEFEGHFNYASRGTTGFDGTVAPRQGQVRFAGELTRAITQNWEMSGYLLVAQVPDFGVRYAGWRLRSRFSTPAEWRLPVHLGLSIEYETARPLFSESARTFELTPILERRLSGVQVILNPTFERDLAGPEREFEFEPKARAARQVHKNLVLGVEYYGSLGESNQWHQVFPTADIRLGEIIWHFGIGFGTRTAADRLVLKTRFELES